MFALTLLSLMAIGAVVEIQALDITGPVVDLFCWNSNSGLALDTSVDLTLTPLDHTVYCMVNVTQCQSSGYAIVYMPLGAAAYEIMYTLTAAENAVLVTALKGIYDAAPLTIGHTMTVSSVTVTGPVVDLYCWENNGGFALDDATLDLTLNPYQHTVFCMTVPAQCRDNGYAIVYQPDGDVVNATWELLYKLDAAGNAMVNQSLVDIYAATPDQIGYNLTITGFDNGNGFLVTDYATVAAPTPPPSDSSALSATEAVLSRVTLLVVLLVLFGFSP